MNFTRKSVSLALLALCLTLPFVAHAEENTAPVRLAIESVCGEGAHVFDIRNVGTVTSSMLRYRVIARAHKSMPALRTWDLLLFPLAPGQAYQFMAPRAAFGLKLTIEVAVDNSTVVTQSNQPISYPSFCW